MQLTPIKTRILQPPKDDIYKLFDESVKNLQEGDVFIITSKILSIHQGRCIKINSITNEDKDNLVKKEADKYLPRKFTPSRKTFLTIKNKMIVSSAGIDQSNGNGFYVLRPKSPEKEAKKIYSFLRNKYNLNKFGVIITDSHSIPLRNGSLGISVAFYGFEPLLDKRQTADIFGNEIKYTRVNVVDALAAAGTLIMGETNERTPIAVVKNLPNIKFTDKNKTQELFPDEKSDYFYDLLKNFKKS